MDQHDSKIDSEEKMDYEALAIAVDEMRETFRAAVAGLIVDGFTKREAHALVAGCFSLHLKDKDDSDD